MTRGVKRAASGGSHGLKKSRKKVDGAGEGSGGGGEKAGSRMVQRIEEALREVADHEYGKRQSQYLRHKFACMGVPAPLLKETSKRVYGEGVGLKDLSEEDVREAARLSYDNEHREMHYWAVSMLNVRHDALDLDMAKELIMRHSWWDTVDSLACNVVGPIVLRDRKAGTKEMKEWLKSDDMWVRRSSLLHQLKYQKDTDVKLLLDSCEALCGEQDFFIRKAIGWALRGYARTDGVVVVDFCNKMGDRMSPLSRKEALKHADKPGRNFNMNPSR